MNPVFHHYRFCELSNVLLYNALKLRSDVFVVEQNCVYPDLDDKDTDSSTLHIISESNTLLAQDAANNQVIAYARCLAPGVSYTGSSIGRVAVTKDARSQGLATLLMIEAIVLCKQYWPAYPIQIGAQEYLQDFYNKLGFSAYSEPYDEDGIMHIDMQYD